MQHTFLRTSSYPHARRGARLLLVALLGLLGVLAGCGSLASPGAPANHTRLTPTPPPAQPTIPVALFSLQMIDATSGWASRGPLSILHTTTGPQHWHDVTPNFHTDAPTAAVNDFLDSQHAWVGLALLSGADAPLHSFALWHTSDGGQHWQQTQLHARGYEIGSIFFLTAQLGWLSVARIEGEKTDAVIALDIFRTQDGGLTWTLISSASDSQHANSGDLPMGVSGPLVFASPTRGWVVGTTAILNRDGSRNPLRIYSTNDGGRTWQPQELPLPVPDALNVGPEAFFSFHNGLDAIMPATLVASSSTFVLYGTHDGGATWNVSIPISLDANSCAHRCSFDFVDMQHGWFSGDRLYRTEDGGRDFRAFPLPEEASSEGFLHMDFVSPTLGWALSVVSQTKRFLLLQTTNGGQSWTVLAPTVG
jgi:photosystem II stability/assembly factor-like uncharacterized protein